MPHTPRCHSGKKALKCYKKGAKSSIRYYPYRYIPRYPVSDAVQSKFLVSTSPKPGIFPQVGFFTFQNSSFPFLSYLLFYSVLFCTPYPLPTSPRYCMPIFYTFPRCGTVTLIFQLCAKILAGPVFPFHPLDDGGGGCPYSVKIFRD
jgi:hypothetical protein